MRFTALVLTLHDIGTYLIGDYTSDGTANGRFVNDGVRAYSALKKHEAIHYKNADGEEIFIPYHAVSTWRVDTVSGELVKPEDSFCQPLECQTAPVCPGGSGSNTVGDAIVGEATVG